MAYSLRLNYLGDLLAEPIIKLSFAKFNAAGAEVTPQLGNGRYSAGVYTHTRTHPPTHTPSIVMES